MVQAFDAAVVDVAACAVKYPPCLGYEDGGIRFGSCCLERPGVSGEVVLICYVGNGLSEDC